MLWLSQFIGGCYGRLFLYHTMLSCEFYSPINMDDSRMMDALILRDSYPKSHELPEFPPSILEVLVALAIRMEHDILCSIEFDDRTTKWFEMFLENLGLEFITDGDWSNEREDYVHWVLERFVDHKYRKDGSNGGIFVVSMTPRESMDFRKVGLWDQMTYWHVKGGDEIC